MRFRKEKHEFTYPIVCDNCGAGIKDRITYDRHKC